MSNNVDLVLLLLRRIQKRKLLRTTIIATLLNSIDIESKKYKKSHWIRPFLQNRKTRGDFCVAVPEMLRDDPSYFTDTFRVDPSQFEFLLQKIGPKLAKNSIREPICPAERMQITLVYLASGDMQKSIAKNYRVGRTTVHNIIKETCVHIYEVLQPDYLPIPTTNKWNQIAEGFNDVWQFPHCIGAIDGKHLQIPAPENSSTTYFNYKGFFSIVLLGLCDADYKFTYINVGASGSESDGGIFQRSELYRKMVNQELGIPVPKDLYGQMTPFAFVADAAFPLMTNIMKPFPGELTVPQRVFNYRLSRARRVIENAFGILVARWRLFNDCAHLSPQNAEVAAKACIVLHNYLKSDGNGTRYCPPGFTDIEIRGTGEIQLGQWRNEVTISHAVGQQGSNNYSRSNAENRDHLMRFFNSRQGAVDWQLDRIIDY